MLEARLRLNLHQHIAQVGGGNRSAPLPFRRLNPRNLFFELQKNPGRHHDKERDRDCESGPVVHTSIEDRKSHRWQFRGKGGTVRRVEFEESYFKRLCDATICPSENLRRVFQDFGSDIVETGEPEKSNFPAHPFRSFWVVCKLLRNSRNHVVNTRRPVGFCDPNHPGHQWSGGTQSATPGCEFSGMH